MLLRRGQEAGNGQGDSPSTGAAVQDARGATAMLLKKEIADTTSGPVGAKAWAPLYVEHFHPRWIALTMASLNA